MIPALTCALPIEIDDESLDLSNAEQIWVSLEQSSTKITVSGDKVVADGHSVTAYFSQEETLLLNDNETAFGQVNWIYNENGAITRGGTETFPVEVGKQLLRRTLP